ncbi:hypothetical protein PCE1_004014 [Barthelona sp. PCE]
MALNLKKIDSPLLLVSLTVLCTVVMLFIRLANWIQISWWVIFLPLYVCDIITLFTASSAVLHYFNSLTSSYDVADVDALIATTVLYIPLIVFEIFLPWFLSRVSSSNDIWIPLSAYFVAFVASIITYIFKLKSRRSGHFDVMIMFLLPFFLSFGLKVNGFVDWSWTAMIYSQCFSSLICGGLLMLSGERLNGSTFAISNTLGFLLLAQWSSSYSRSSFLVWSFLIFLCQFFVYFYVAWNRPPQNKWWVSWKTGSELPEYTVSSNYLEPVPHAVVHEGSVSSRSRRDSLSTIRSRPSSRGSRSALSRSSSRGSLKSIKSYKSSSSKRVDELAQIDIQFT